MSDCTAIYPAKPIECLLGAGHDGDHAGEDSAGFQFRWSKPNADMVPAARLDAANLEIARLKGVIRRVAESMGHSGGEAPEYLPCNDSCSDCDDETIGEKHRSDLPEDRCSEHPDADGELDCWRCLLTAALTPKELSDV